MIKTFEELFEKMEADGKKKRKLQDAYEWLEECHIRKNTEDITASELRDLYDGIVAKRIRIEGYLDCLCDDGYISNEEWIELYKVMFSIHYR